MARQNAATRRASRNHRSSRGQFFGGLRGLQNSFSSGGGKNAVLGFLSGITGQMQQHVRDLPDSDKQRISRDLGVLKNFGEQVSGRKIRVASLGNSGLGDLLGGIIELLNAAKDGGLFGNSRPRRKPRRYTSLRSSRDRLRNFTDSDYQRLNQSERYMIRTYKHFNSKRVSKIYEAIKHDRNGVREKVNEKFVKLASKMSGESQYTVMDKITHSTNLKDLLKTLNIKDSSKFLKKLKKSYEVSSLKIIDSKFATV